MTDLTRARDEIRATGTLTGSLGVFYEVSLDLPVQSLVSVGPEAVGYSAIDIATGELRNFVYLGGSASITAPGVDFDRTNGVFYSQASIDDFTGFSFGGSFDFAQTSLGGSYSPGTGATMIFTGSTTSSPTVKLSAGYTLTAAGEITINELAFDGRPSLAQIATELQTAATDLNGNPVSGVFDGVTLTWREQINETTTDIYEVEILPGA